VNGSNCATPGPTTVVVLGYTGEPYLRITSTSVEENQLSPTVYINRSLFADAVPTSQTAGSVAPAWARTANTGTVRWHDHRIHWMGQARPPAVVADPRHAHQIGSWTVHATAGNLIPVAVFTVLVIRLRRRRQAAVEPVDPAVRQAEPVAAGHRGSSTL
jgi:hypothetical protein